MPSYNTRTLETCFTKKLGSKASKGTGDKEFDFYDDDGNLMATTWLSRGWTGSTPIGANMVSKIRKQLNLQNQPDAFDQLIRCPLSRPEWLALIGGVVRSDQR